MIKVTKSEDKQLRKGKRFVNKTTYRVGRQKVTRARYNSLVKELRK